MFGFVKVKKFESKGFGYKPRYFDQEKEEMMSKIKKAESNEKTTNDDNDYSNKEFVKLRIKEELRSAKSNSRRELRGLWQGSNIRLITIIIILIGLTYFILNKFLPIFLQFIFNE